MPEEELDLIQFATGKMTQTCAGAPEMPHAAFEELCRMQNYAEFVAPSPAVPSIFSGSARCAIRHSLAQVQRLCRNVNSASSGLKRRCGAAIGAVLLRARSFIAKSASR